MNDKPILFSTPMVQSIDYNWKTQTRRTRGLELVNSRPDDFTCDGLSSGANHSTLAGFRGKKNPLEYACVVRCPYGSIGDFLWVRETWAPDVRGGFYYKATVKCFDSKWKPSIHMPKSAARTWLRIKDIRVERLQNISEADAVAEGIKRLAPWPEVPDRPRYHWYGMPGAGDQEAAVFDPLMSFASLWTTINGSTSYISNPWVWVIEFEKLVASEVKTSAGFSIKNFSRLDIPESRGILDPFVFEGILVDGTLSNQHIHVKWDEMGRCSNWQRSDAFLRMKTVAEWQQKQESIKETPL